jgi:hypothetical protein
VGLGEVVESGAKVDDWGELRPAKEPEAMATQQVLEDVELGLH